MYTCKYIFLHIFVAPVYSDFTAAGGATIVIRKYFTDTVSKHQFQTEILECSQLTLQQAVRSCTSFTSMCFKILFYLLLLYSNILLLLLIKYLILQY